MTTCRQKSARLKLKGDCSIYEITDLCKKLSELLKKAPVVTLDLSSVERADASFLQLLVAVRAEAEASQTRLALSHPSDPVKTLIESLYFDASMEPAPGPSDAGAQ